MNRTVSNDPLTAVLLVAAGSSTRFGRDKLMVPIHGEPLFTYSLKAFANTPLISSIVLVVPPGREEEFQRVIDLLTISKLSSMTHLVAGGRTRHESVQRGLRAIPASMEFIAIHDAARPLIREKQIESVCRAAYQAGAAALALPVTESLHRSDAHQYAQETVDRSRLWSMQTPQVFRALDLIDLFNANLLAQTHHPTDEVAALLPSGIQTLFVENQEPNVKVTYPSDLMLVSALCSMRRNEVEG